MLWIILVTNSSPPPAFRILKVPPVFAGQESLSE